MSPTDDRASRDLSRSSAAREGFALPLSIMVLALLTMGLVTGFAMSTSEQSATMSQRAQARAYSYAQSGLELFIARRKDTCGLPLGASAAATAASSCTFCPQCWTANGSPSSGNVSSTLDLVPTRAESVTVAFAGGNALVRATPVWVDVAAGRGTYFVTSTGTDNSSLAATGLGRTRAATRTVGVFVSWNQTTINVLGALVSFAGIRKNGTGEISGIDECGSGANVPGVTVPLDKRVQVNGGFTPTGNPPYDTLKTFTQDSSASKLDWAGIRDGTALPADITIPSGTFPSSGTFAADTNYWPVIHVTTDFSLPWRGRGMLIVDGDLVISGSNQWDGVILVGGKLTSNGNNVTSGTVMAGLDRLIGGSPGVTDEGDLNGTKSYIYNSCSVAKATSSQARYTMTPNTWMDNVAGY
ncbi:MAG: hypothetical protein JWL95_511 [Gemmatimonadetes bacterium]|nr:hypothetical protein [Gemmatimonadota bacterium]